jgi:hypothetical protein
MQVNGHRVARVLDDHACVVCGKPVVTYVVTRLYCGRPCQMRSWRAAAKLAGTHGWVDGQFRRLPVASG